MNDTAPTPDAGAEPIAAPEPIVEDRSDIPDQVAPRSISDIVSDVLKDMPTTPENIANQVAMDVTFWADYGEQLEQRFNAWAAK